MNNLYVRRFFPLVFILSLALGSCNTLFFHNIGSRNAERKLFGNSLGKKKEAKVKEPRTVLKAKKKQEANDRKLKKEYEKSVKRSQKRTIEIQSPEVQARMKKNQKDSAARDRLKKKKIKRSSKKYGGKYK